MEVLSKATALRGRIDSRGRGLRGGGLEPPSYGFESRPSRTSTRHRQLLDQVSPTLESCRCLIWAPGQRFCSNTSSPRTWALLLEQGRFSALRVRCACSPPVVHGPTCSWTRGSSGLSLCRRISLTSLLNLPVRSWASCLSLLLTAALSFPLGHPPSSVVSLTARTVIVRLS